MLEPVGSSGSEAALVLARNDSGGYGNARSAKLVSMAAPRKPLVDAGYTLVDRGK